MFKWSLNCVCWKFSFCISMEMHSFLLLKKPNRVLITKWAAQAQDETKSGRKDTWYVYLSFFPFRLIVVFIAHTRLRYLLAFSFMDYSTCGRVYCMYIWFVSPRAKHCSSHLCVCCASAPVLSWQYIVLYTYHVSLCLQARGIWGYYWAAGKASSKIHVSNVLLQVATKFRGYYTTLFPRKVIACFENLFPRVESCLFTSWMF